MPSSLGAPLPVHALSSQAPSTPSPPSDTALQSQDSSSPLAQAAMVSLPPSSPPAPNSSRPRFSLGGPPSRPPSRRPSSTASNRRQSIDEPKHVIDKLHSTRRNSSILRTSRNGSDLKSSTSSSSIHNATSPATSYACRRSDSGCFSDSTLSDPTSATSGVELSRATSCAHPECVMATPCERMFELSEILSWPTPRTAQTFSPISSAQDSSSDIPRQARKDLMILDNACGPSALVTSQLTHLLPVELMEEAQFVATDLSTKVVAEATRRIAELDWADHVFTYKMAQEHMLGLDDASFTHVFTNFGIYLAKDVEATLKEMKRILVPGGICAFTVWKHLPWLDILAKAIKEEYPQRPMLFPCHEDAILSLTRWNPWHDPDWIKKMIMEAGFSSTLEEKSYKGVKDVDEDENKDRDSDDKKEDWSQYEYNSSESRSSSRKNSKTSSAPPVSSPKTGSLAAPASTPTSPSSNSSKSEDSSITIEEVSSIHRYTKHEFMSNFGTSVLDHLISASWGKESITKEESRRNLKEAILRYLIRLCPDQFDEIELELKALVVVVRKSNKKDIPSQM